MAFQSNIDVSDKVLKARPSKLTFNEKPSNFTEEEGNDDENDYDENDLDYDEGDDDFDNYDNGEDDDEDYDYEQDYDEEGLPKEGSGRRNPYRAVQAWSSMPRSLPRPVIFDNTEDSELIALNSNIKTAKEQVSNVAQKTEVYLQTQSDQVTLLATVEQELATKQQTIRQLQVQLDEMHPETADEARIRVSAEKSAYDNALIRLRDTRAAHKAINIPGFIAQPTQPRRQNPKAWQAFENEMRAREALKTQKTALHNQIGTREEDLRLCQSALDRAMAQPSPYQLIKDQYSAGMTDLESFMQVIILPLRTKVREYDVLKAKTASMDRELEKAQSALDKFNLRGMVALKKDHTVVYDDKGDVKHIISKEFQTKMQELNSNPPTRTVITYDLSKKLERDFLVHRMQEIKEMLDALSSVDMDEEESEYYHVLLNDYKKIKLELKKLDEEIAKLPKAAWIEKDEVAFEAKKQQIYNQHPQEFVEEEKPKTLYKPEHRKGWTMSDYLIMLQTGAGNSVSPGSSNAVAGNTLHNITLTSKEWPEL
jgi:hypothetical protein